jgi:hypothetical protein
MVIPGGPWSRDERLAFLHKVGHLIGGLCLLVPPANSGSNAHFPGHFVYTEDWTRK